MGSRFSFSWTACVAGLAIAASASETAYDLVIYGSSPAAISAAVQAGRMGKTAVVVSPETRIGGLTTGGLGQTDIGNKSAFGGIALEFYQEVADHYRKEANWKWQRRSDYLPDGQCADTKGEDSMWTFEPSAALRILEGWEKRDGLKIVRGKRLNRSAGKVKVEGEGDRRRIVSFETEDGTVFVGRMFVDATYEGDLMAAAGVSYRVGREANSEYGETISGVQHGNARYHQFQPRVDPYVVKGDPSSGLLPNVEPYDPSEKDGDGDRRVQAYCFRMCLTDVPENRIPFKKPGNYDERNYELLFRNFEALPPDALEGDLTWKLPWINSKMPNRKTDTNNRDAFSTDFIGRNWDWPEADYATRERILREHLDYQRGLMWTLANHPRVPEPVRREVSRWGTCRDEFADGLGDGWQGQLYVREARRMVGDVVMTQDHCQNRVVAARPVAMGAYQMDSHNVRRAVTKDGFVRNEGDVEIGGCRPYPIDYGAIVPKRGECANLFVPVCLSATHMAFGSIRMEPVFFALGQAAGTAAALAVEAGCAVQDLPYGPLASRLRDDGQVLPSAVKLRGSRLARTVVVAAANTPDDEKASADLVCTGQHDEEVINEAISRLTKGGTVQLLDGDYTIDGFAREGASAICVGYNGGQARTVNIVGTTENKSYNTRFGVSLHVSRRAMDALPAGRTARVFFGASKRPKARGDFFTYTHVNNVNFENFYLFLADASKPVRGIDGSNFGQMFIQQVGVYTERYFEDRFLHEKPKTPCRDSVGVYSVPGSCDEMSRIGYDFVNVGGLHTGFHFNEVDHLVMRSCSAARCCYGYVFKGGPKTLTLLNCCDEGNTHLPKFLAGGGHLTAIDFNIERFNAAYIPDDPDGVSEPYATEVEPGSWSGSLSYTLQGAAFGLKGFWKEGHGTRFATTHLDAKVPAAKPVRQTNVPDYRVFVNGRAVELIEAPKPDKYYPNHLTDEQAQPYWAALADATGEVEVRVESDCRDLSATRILPERPDVAAVSREKGVMTFRAKVPFKVSVEPTPRFRSLTVVVREPDPDAPSDGAPGVRRFRRGRHHIDEPILLGSNETLYLDEGAFVEAAVYATGTNIAVRGHGVLSGACWPWRNGPAPRLLKFEDAKDVLVRDVALLGPYEWSFVLHRVERALVDGLVLLGGKVINDDGIDICRSKDATVRNSFIHVQDDCIAVKWSGENIMVENCILWADVARIFHLGYESDNAQMRGIRVRNVDVLHQSVAKPKSGQPVVRIEASNGLRIGDVDFDGIDIWSPESGDALLGVYTSVIRTVKGWTWYDKAGEVRDVRIRNVRYHGQVPEDCGAVRMNGYDSGAGIENIVVEDLGFSPKTVEISGHVSGAKVNGLSQDSCCVPKQQ